MSDAEIDDFIRADTYAGPTDDLAGRIYSVTVYDCDPADDGSAPPEWSESLAVTHLGGPADGLTLGQCRAAVRALFAGGWSEFSISVTAEAADEPTVVEATP